MATRRGKKTQARRGGTARGAPSLLWLLGALLVGAVLAGVVLMRDRIGASLDIPARTPATEPSPQNKSPTAKQPTPKKPTYEFYELLPEKEVMIPDAELTATARAERERPAPPRQRRPPPRATCCKPARSAMPGAQRKSRRRSPSPVNSPASKPPPSTAKPCTA